MSKDKKNFVKQLSVFNVKDAVEEIFEIIEDKIKMKNLKVASTYFGFGAQTSKYDFYINSDQKRLQ